jgi:hypothetical protein
VIPQHLRITAMAVAIGLSCALGCATEPELPPLERAARAMAELDLLTATEAYREAGEATRASHLERAYSGVLAAQRAARDDRDLEHRAAALGAVLDAAGTGPETGSRHVGDVVADQARALYDHEPEDIARLVLLRALVLAERFEEARELLHGRPAVAAEGIEGLRLRLRVHDTEQARRLAAMLLRRDPGDAELLWLSAQQAEAVEDFDAARALLARATKAGSREAQRRLTLYQSLYGGRTSTRRILAGLRAATARPELPDAILHLDALHARLAAQGQRISNQTLERVRADLERHSDGPIAQSVMRGRIARVAARKRALDASAAVLPGVIRAASEAFPRNDQRSVRSAIRRTDAAAAALGAPLERLRVRARVLTPPVAFSTASLSRYTKARDELAQARALEKGARHRPAPPAAIAAEASLGEARGRELLKARIAAAGTLEVAELQTGFDWLTVRIVLPPTDVPGAAYESVRERIDRHVRAVGIGSVVPALFERFDRLEVARVILRSESGNQVARFEFDRRAASALGRRGASATFDDVARLAGECWYRVDDAVEIHQHGCRREG